MSLGLITLALLARNQNVRTSKILSDEAKVSQQYLARPLETGLAEGQLKPNNHATKYQEACCAEVEMKGKEGIMLHSNFALYRSR
jgi:hypothetical protein